MRVAGAAGLTEDLLCRLERNQQREESVANMEYLKNVVLKASLFGCVLADCGTSAPLNETFTAHSSCKASQKNEQTSFQ